MINKIWRYFIMKVLISTGEYREGLGFTRLADDVEYVFNFIMKDQKIRDTKDCPVAFKEVCNG